MSRNHKSCLVLNADYSPIGIIGWQKAIVWAYRFSDSSETKTIEILEYHNDDHVISISGNIKIPSVIKTHRYFKINNTYVNFSRKNLFLRDDFTCQYCHTKLNTNQLTYDHVIPKSQWNKNGSPTCWTNIVTACRKCNAKKANKTPVQAGMFLKNAPYIPKKSHKYLHIHTQLSTIRHNMPESWSMYIY